MHGMALFIYSQGMTESRLKMKWGVIKWRYEEHEQDVLDEVS